MPGRVTIFGTEPKPGGEAERGALRLPVPAIRKNQTMHTRQTSDGWRARKEKPFTLSGNLAAKPVQPVKILLP